MCQAQALPRCGLEPVADALVASVFGVGLGAGGQGCRSAQLVFLAGAFALDTASAGRLLAYGHGRGLKARHGFTRQPLVLPLLDQLKMCFGFRGDEAHGHTTLPCTTGALITVKAIHELQRIQGRYALVTMCIGGGQGIAAIFERI